MAAYKFTSNYFGTCEIKLALDESASKTANWKILEIGSFEGSSAVYFSDNLLDHPDSELTCVDPFISDDPTTPFSLGGNDTMHLFINNISKSKNFQKITLRRMFSSEFYKKNTKKFNFIYVDGSHLVEDIKNDFIECLKILEPGGYLAFDDYNSGDGSIKNCIDDLYEENKHRLQILGHGYQILFQRTQ
jgi:predicted O-methyltransferase YrrM